MIQNRNIIYFFFSSLLTIFGCSLLSHTQSTNPIGVDEGDNAENLLPLQSPTPTNQEDMLTNLLQGNGEFEPINAENAGRLVELGYFLRGPATDVAFSEDGKWLAVCSLDSGLALYDIESQQEMWFTEEGTGCEDVEISSAANSVATNKGIWNIETGQKLVFSEYIEYNSFWFSPDGKSLMLYQKNRVVNGFEAIPANEQNSLPVYFSEWDNGQFSPDGNLFVSYQWNQNDPSKYGLKLITFPQGKEIQFIPCDTWRGLFSFSGDGSQLFIRTSFTFETWGLDGKLINKINYDSEYFPYDTEDFPIYINGDYIVFQTEKNVRIANAVTQKNIYSYEFNEIASRLPAGTNFFLSPKNNFLAISDEKGLQVVEIKTGKQIILSNQYSTVGDGDIYFSPDKPQMIITNFTLDWNSETQKPNPLSLVTIWDLQSKRIVEQTTFDGYLIYYSQPPLTAINLGQNKTWKIFRDLNGDFWQYNNSTQKSEFLMSINPPSNNQLSLINFDKLVWVPNELSGAELIPIGNLYILSPDGKMLAIFKENNLLLWDVENKKSLADIELQNIDESIFRTMFSKNNKSLIIVSKNGVWLLDTEIPNQFNELINNEDFWAFESLDFTKSPIDISPDGSVLAKVHKQTGIDLIPCYGEFTGINYNYRSRGSYREYRTITFSNDGKILATGTNVGTVELFIAPPILTTPPSQMQNNNNIEVVSPADKSIVNNLHPEIQVNIPNLPEGGSVDLYINHDWKSSWTTYPYDEKYVFTTTGMNLEPGNTYTWHIEISFPDQPLITSREYTFTTP